MIPSNEGRVNNAGIITISPNTIKQNEIQIKVAKNSPTGKSEILTPADLGTWQITGELILITTNKVPEGEIWYVRSIQTINRITLENYPLENLDTIRDKILLKETTMELLFAKVKTIEKQCFMQIHKRDDNGTIIS